MSESRSEQPVKAEWIDIHDHLKGWLAQPDDPKGAYPAVIVFIEAFGVNEHFQSLAKRLAATGLVVLIPDIYHGKVYSYEDLQGAIGHLRTLSDDKSMAAAKAALDYLRQTVRAKSDAIAVLGFCMGGRLAFLANAELAGDLRCAVCFYPGGVAPKEDAVGRKPLLDKIESMSAPILIHYGAEDASIAPDEHARIVEALSQAKKRYGIEVYPEAGHGFFCEARTSYNAVATQESWTITQQFFDTYLRS